MSKIECFWVDAIYTAYEEHLMGDLRGDLITTELDEMCCAN